MESKSGKMKKAVFMSYRIPFEGVKGSAKEKIKSSKEDKRYPALVILELILIFSLVAAIVFYLDPEYDILPIPWNFASFAIMVVAVFWIYSYTTEFRQMDFVQKN